jgi:asparagine synthase (glutamine-hydrolysing)
MCGICGIVSSSFPAEKSVRAVTAMNTALAHRGPDAEGIWHNEHAYLGHRRLSIIDLSDDGRQPMFSFDKRYVIVYNGELYNYKELKLELQRATQGSSQQPYFFSTQTDTEVILAAYMRWGKDCLQRFNGMFAFSIYDTAERTLFVARDRMGIKPLYYTTKNNSLLFASELRAILRSGFVEKKIRRDSLVDYLEYQTVHAPHTIVEDIQMLLPGHYLWFRNGTAEIHSWWKMEESVNDKSANQSYEEICGDIRSLFLSAVERRLVADVPFGAFLSGGIDSTAVVAAMAQVSSHPVKTFSVVFDESAFSEAQYSRMAAKLFKTDHHEINLSPADFLHELPDALRAMDHPSGDGPNTYVVSKATRKAGITMALSGLGSDELFCGYDIFKRLYKLEQQYWLNLIPRLVRFPAGSAMKYFSKQISGRKTGEILSKPLVNFMYAYPVSRQVLPDDEVKRLMHLHELPMNQVYRYLRIHGLSSGAHRLSKYSIAEMGTYMQNVLLRDTDQMSMAVALEVRVPFLDYKLVEYVLGVSDKHKYPHSPKKLLTDSLKDLIPPEIINRKKMGFVLPWEHWMKNEIKDFCMSRLSNLEELGLDRSRIQLLWSKFEKSDPLVTWSRIWPLVTLGSWSNSN